MSLVQFVRASLEMSFHPVLTLAEDMKDAPLTFPTPRGGNHPLWIMGHLASSEAAIIHQFAFGKPNPFPPYFGNHEIWHICVLAGNTFLAQLRFRLQQ